ncbi:MAG TPA: hypothetical protein DCM05_13330 [Elusimicrobia bacterium]|nr:hypothetical protein [Elusimicrobiota bacterium]
MAEAGFAELVESSVRASLAAESVFEGYRESETSGSQAAANLALWSCAAALLCAGLAYARLEAPPEPPILLLAAAAGALGLLLAGLAGAAALHALTSLVGSEAPFGKSLLLVSLLSPILLPHVGAFWAPFPYLWLGTTAYAVWLFTRGLVRMQALQESGALMAVGFLGMALAGAQAAVVKEGARLREALESKTEDAAKPAAPVALSVPDAAPRSTLEGAPAEPAPEGTAPSPDSVGMVQGTDLEAAQRLPGQQEAFALDTGGDPAKTMSSLDKWSQKLDENSDLARGMPPEQREQLKKVKEAVDSVRLQSAQSGRAPSKDEVLLKVIMQLGAANQQQSAQEPPAQPKPVKKKRPRRRDSEEPDLDTPLGIE